VQLDKFNLQHSYPSGHVAASVAIYGALGLLLAAHFKDIRARVLIWTVAAAFPLSVATSRIYRGEHHPIDVIAGALMGAGALVVALFAARTARRVAELRTVRHAERRAAEARA
jgi:undecaprenyl-diphosphatase